VSWDEQGHFWKVDSFNCGIGGLSGLAKHCIKREKDMSNHIQDHDKAADRRNIDEDQGAGITFLGRSRDMQRTHMETIQMKSIEGDRM
jgi:hypothetical protein